ncbi:ABC transporter permease [Mastigocoleus testarum]|uniref:Nitrate transporter n=1 Tax=Mastigocoleus testarum BC008 TaxID=371196 RepID=A0A0V7ZJJ7_9CYAN|nr:hypothetical protein [Mastigocoleus testarum]KST63970.1 nitrate transporter [Mastigocoleus testarum BC008]KST64680.1 nitrate transporter [Mastigocoleus testarum BC008]
MGTNIFLDILNSLQLLFVGYTPAAAFGIAIGILVGINRLIYQICKRLFQIPHSVTPIAFLPLALILLRQPEPASIVVVFVGSLWTIIVQTAAGVQAFRNRGNNLQLAIEYIFYALRQGVWVAWFAVIATEMLTGGSGVGFLLWDAYNNGNINYIIEAIAYIGTIGFLLDQILELTAFLVSKLLPKPKEVDE